MLTLALVWLARPAEAKKNSDLYMVGGGVYAGGAGSAGASAGPPIELSAAFGSAGFGSVM